MSNRKFRKIHKFSKKKLTNKPDGIIIDIT